MPDASALPASEPGLLRHSARRTLVLRSLLGGGLLALLVLAVVVARGEDMRNAPLVPSGKTGILVLDLSASTSEAAFAQTIQKLANADERVGVVAFSDAAYELVPPGSPGRELLPLLRFFTAVDGKQPPAQNPWDEFRAGTRVSEGLRVAGDILREEGISTARSSSSVTSRSSRTRFSAWLRRSAS